MDIFGIVTLLSLLVFSGDDNYLDTQNTSTHSFDPIAIAASDYVDALNAKNAAFTDASVTQDHLDAFDHSIEHTMIVLADAVASDLGLGNAISFSREEFDAIVDRVDEAVAVVYAELEYSSNHNNYEF